MQVKQPDMSSADIKELKKMILEMRETLNQTDTFVKGNLLTKIELLSTGLEDANTVTKNLENKYNSYKGTFDSLDANIREQLDIIQSLNGKINVNYEQQQKFKQDIFDRFLQLSEECLS